MSNLKFKEYKGLDLSRINEDILKQWDADDTFHRSIETREGHPTFVFYEGPLQLTANRVFTTSWREP